MLSSSIASKENFKTVSPASIALTAFSTVMVAGVHEKYVGMFLFLHASNLFIKYLSKNGSPYPWRIRHLDTTEK